MIKLPLKWLCLEKLSRKKESLTIQEERYRTRKLVDIFPVSCKPLFLQFTNEELTGLQTESTAFLLKALHYNASWRAIIPLDLIDIMEEALDKEEISKDQLKIIVEITRKFEMLLDPFLEAFHDC